MSQSENPADTTYWIRYTTAAGKTKRTRALADRDRAEHWCRRLLAEDPAVTAAAVVAGDSGISAESLRYATQPDSLMALKSENDPIREAIVEALWVVIDNCVTLLDAHQQEGLACDCDQCKDLRGLHYNAELSESVLSSPMYFWPAQGRRALELTRNGGDRPAVQVLEMLCDRDDDDEPANAGSPIPSAGNPFYA